MFYTEHEKTSNFIEMNFLESISLIFSDERLTGATVEVCDGDKCKKCGKFGEVGKGKWGSVKCGGSKGIKGSSVKVVAPKNYLQIAKAKVIGTSKCVFK